MGIHRSAAPRLTTAGLRHAVRRGAAARRPNHVAPAGSHRDDGFVTAELAITLPAVVIVLAAVLATATVVVNQIRCIDAARAAAREASRNESTATVTDVARAVGPPGTRVTLDRTGDRVGVTVSADVVARIPGTPALHLRSRAVGLREADGDVATQGTSAAILAATVTRGRRRHPTPAQRSRRRRLAAHQRRRRPRRDRGAGTVLALGVVLVGFGTALLVAAFGGAVVARHQAESAADLAALAAARTATTTGVGGHGSTPCDSAAGVAADNGAQLTSCAVDVAGTATVGARIAPNSMIHVFQATARARAGPAETSLGEHRLRKVVLVTH